MRVIDHFTFQSAFRKTLPIMAAYLFLGLGFGLLLGKAGLGPLCCALMVLGIYSGAMQYVAVPILVSGMSLPMVALTTVLVQVRHIFYSISMAPLYKDVGWRRFFLFYGLTDETYAVLCDGSVPEGADRTRYWFYVTFLNESYWFVGCMLGDILVRTLNFDAPGVGFIMTAMFVSIFVDQWREAGSHLPAIGGVVATALSLILFGPQNFLLPAMALILVLLFAGRSQLEPLFESAQEERGTGS